MSKGGAIKPYCWKRASGPRNTRGALPSRMNCGIVPPVKGLEDTGQLKIARVGMETHI